MALPPKSTPPNKKAKISETSQINLKRFTEEYYKGKQDTKIREVYFNTKREQGYTNRMLGLKVYSNNTYRILEEKGNDAFAKYAPFKILHKYLLSERKKLIEKSTQK